jgi:hypothetical protein
VSKFGTLCQGKDGKVFRNNPGGGALGPKREVEGVSVLDASPTSDGVDATSVVGGGGGTLPSGTGGFGAWDSSSEPPLIDRLLNLDKPLSLGKFAIDDPGVNEDAIDDDINIGPTTTVTKKIRRLHILKNCR